MSEAKVVQTDSGREVRMSYYRGCRDYTIGFASAFFLAATVCGYGILWMKHVPEAIYHTSVIFFVVFSLTAFLIVGIAYTSPIWFYQLLEADPECGSKSEQ